MQQQQHNKDNMLLGAGWRRMQEELQGVRGPCYTLTEGKHRGQNIFYQLVSYSGHFT